MATNRNDVSSKTQPAQGEVAGTPYASGVSSERAVQNRVVGMLRERLGYGYWGNLKEQEGGNVNAEALLEFLTAKQGLTVAEAERVASTVAAAARCRGREGLYKANKELYRMMRYPVRVRTEAGKPPKQAWLVDWKSPGRNSFAVAEEVRVATEGGEHPYRRPDLCLYVNGILLGVIELKQATVSVEDGVRQQWRNQQDGEIPGFFATAQILAAGSESEGLKYGTTLTPPKYWVAWKEPCGDPPGPERFGGADVRNEMFRSILQMFEPERFLGLVHDGIVFDAGVKKAMRPNQVAALEAAKPRILRKASGILWHTQGSGKSLMMVWLAQWIRENRPDARVVVITDRDELDRQITNAFLEAGEHPHRVESGEDLVATLGGNRDWLVTTLIHKFGAAGGLGGGSRNGEAPADRRLRGTPTAGQILERVAANLPEGFKAQGDLYVFVDECHRTQGGILNRAMKKIMGEGVMLIGFTGTPLLRADKGAMTSTGNFGPFIHAYKFDEAVADGVVLDLRYEARDVGQSLKEAPTFDRLFEEAARPLTPRAREELKKRWARMQHLFSSRERIVRIATDICKDMALKPALKNGWGNAMLVCESVYQAYRYWSVFEEDGCPLRGHTAVVTSYDGKEPDLSSGFAGETATEADFKCRIARRMFAGRTAEEFEEWAKGTFVREPAKLKLLIVVDKLITGFDAPACSYLYIDKKMADHTLFQAVCRVNRLNGETKDFGRIVDYKQLFESIQGAIGDYTGGAFAGYERGDVEGLLKDDAGEARRALEEALETCRQLAEPVRPPRGIDDFFDWFCYDQAATPAAGHERELARNARKREDFYQACFRAVRAFAAVAPHAARLYPPGEAERLRGEVARYDRIREAVMKRCGDYVDFRRFDAEMRALLDDYVTADHASHLCDLEDFSFLDAAALLPRPPGGRRRGGDAEEKALGGERGVAETLAANVRRYVFRKRESNPAEYRKFSEQINRLLDDYLRGKAAYRAFLEGIRDLCDRLRSGADGADPRLDTEAKRSLADNLGGDADLALRVFRAVETAVKPGFRTNAVRRKKVERAIEEALGGSDFRAADIYRIVERQPEFDGESLGLAGERFP